jgi:hypothetical protein
MSINCNEIQQVGNELLIAFQGCTPFNNNMIKLVELVMAVNNCNSGGAAYDTLIEEVYEQLFHIQ